MLRNLSVAVMIGITTVALSACTSTDAIRSQLSEQNAPANAPAAQPQVKTIGFARWPAAEAGSLKDLVASYSTVVVGTVTAATDLTLSAKPPDDQHTPATSHDPVDKVKAGMQPKPYVPGEDPPTLTGYSVKVSTVIKGAGIRPGDTIQVDQAGGMLKGIAYQLEDNPVIQVGDTYLFFVKNDGGVALTGPPYGRFRIDKNARPTAVDPAWAELPAVKELSVRTIDDAVRTIKAAISGT